MNTSEDSDINEAEDNNLETIEDDHQPEAGFAEDNDNGNENEDESVKKTVKPKRVIRNPQPKLNAERLKGKRGLTALPSYFERVKYKGRGHEEEDLNVILKTYEYWCHRLFPKYPFDECIARIEKLGTKRATVTHVKRIRFDLITDDDPSMSNDVTDLPLDTYDSDDDAPNLEPQSSSFRTNVFDDLVSSSEPTQAVPEIDVELMEQIRLNREKALKLRQERMQSKKLLEETASVMEAANISSQDDVGSEPSCSYNQLLVEHENNKDTEPEAPQKTSTENELPSNASELGNDGQDVI